MLRSGRSHKRADFAPRRPCLDERSCASHDTPLWRPLCLRSRSWRTKQREIVLLHCVVCFCFCVWMGVKSHMKKGGWMFPDEEQWV